jgi:hypothetical protein
VHEVTQRKKAYASQRLFYRSITGSREEEEQLALRSKSSTLKAGRGRQRKYPPKVFTEQGVYMLATILKSPVSSKATVAIMRAFVALRHFALTYGQIVEKLNDLEGKIDEHEDVLQKVIQALSELVNQTETKESRKIGFV